MLLPHTGYTIVLRTYYITKSSSDWSENKRFRAHSYKLGHKETPQPSGVLVKRQAKHLQGSEAVGRAEVDYPCFCF